MRQSLSIAEWHRMAKQGAAPPAHITLSGYSMNPLIRGYRDYVTIIPPDRPPVTGDIVLFHEAGRERYVVHRVWKIQDGRVLTWGDNCREADGWIPAEDVWGRVVLIERGKRSIRPDPEKGMRWARFWHQAGKAWRMAERIRNGIKRRIIRTKA